MLPETFSWRNNMVRWAYQTFSRTRLFQDLMSLQRSRANFGFSESRNLLPKMYNLDELGWVEFEALVQTLLISRLGLGVESWGGTGDWGRDSYFIGKLNYPSTTPSEGPFLFQCKFVAHANSAGARPERLILRATEAECTRIKQRTTDHGDRSARWETPPRHYSLISNAPISGKRRQNITGL